ncbi:MAG: type II secretion system GspH family protein [Lentisphaeraceae bacterium]|nr:type II secretion system GspH family protein [Lentisphaeraceae bacterium]
MQHPITKRKFTLIELLVVVAIIGILSSILLPSLGKARTKAKEALCISQLKQIGYGMYLYADANAETFVEGWKQSGDSVWQSDVNPYMSDEPALIDNPFWWCPLATNLGGNKRHYGLNVYTRNANWKGKMAVVPKASETILVGEQNKNVELVLPWSLSVGQGNVESYIRSSHNFGNGSSLLFVDAHVASFRRDMGITANINNTKFWHWW